MNLGRIHAVDLPDGPAPVGQHDDGVGGGAELRQRLAIPSRRPAGVPQPVRHVLALVVSAGPLRHRDQFRRRPRQPADGQPTGRAPAVGDEPVALRSAEPHQIVPRAGLAGAVIGDDRRQPCFLDGPQVTQPGAAVLIVEVNDVRADRLQRRREAGQRRLGLAEVAPPRALAGQRGEDMHRHAVVFVPAEVRPRHAVDADRDRAAHAAIRQRPRQRVGVDLLARGDVRRVGARQMQDGRRPIAHGVAGPGVAGPGVAGPGVAGPGGFGSHHQCRSWSTLSSL